MDNLLKLIKDQGFNLLNPQDPESALKTGLQEAGNFWEGLTQDYTQPVPKSASGQVGRAVNDFGMATLTIPQPLALVGLGLKVPKVISKTAPKAPELFKGFDDLTTKTLNKLVGISDTSNEFIRNLTNQPELKQAERELIRGKLDKLGPKVNVSKFADSVKDELLPLKRTPMNSTRYNTEQFVLPDDLRGAIASYQDHVYESPIKTSAGTVHNYPSDSYLAHTRVEDLVPDDFSSQLANPSKTPYDMQGGSTRRVIEIQSDLFQKGRLEGSIGGPSKGPYVDVSQENTAGLKALKPYENTWHERVIKEEVKQAAIDGKTKLQFPTGETAMKIEGLGGEYTNPWVRPDVPTQIKLEDLKIGNTISHVGTEEDWIITDVLGDGKFRAVSNQAWAGLKLRGYKINDIPRSETEVFDISGKVDTENPIYKFYEKEVGRYLTNKYGAKVITDPQGVKWYQLDVKPEQGKMPIEAFGALPFMAGSSAQLRQNQEEQ